MAVSSYGKIYNLGHAAVLDIFKDVVILEEKLDGSQLSFQKLNGEIFIRSKGKQIVLDAPEKMFTIGVEQILARKDLLKEGWVYRGEFLNKPKHNHLVYDRVPKDNIIIFDIDTGDQCYLSYEEKKEEAARIGFEVVPKFYEGKVESKDMFMSLLEKESCLGGAKIEGFVIKNYHRFCPDGKAMMAKFVSEKFKENQKREWKAVNNPDIMTMIVDSLQTEARWRKAVQHLKETGELEHSPRDIGKLIKELDKDIVEEEEDWIKEKLFKWAIKDILRKVKRGFPEWYKEQLLNRAFDE